MSRTFEARAEAALGDALRQGARKFLGDVWTVLEMKLLFLIRGWYWYLIRALVFPLGMFFWLRVLAPDDPEVVLRFLTGAIIFGVTLMTANMLAQQLLLDRHLGRLKLLITMPVSKVSYAFGVLAFAVVQAVPMIGLILLAATISGVEYSPTWAFLPLIAALLISLAGVTLIIASHAPSMEVGGIVSSLVGIGLVMLSPVFFTMDQAPLVLNWLGWVSPMKYAADGMNQALSGGTDIWLEFGIICAFTVSTMILGLWKLRWRDS